MADRYDDRYRTDEFRGERGYGRHDRGPIDRASDEVRSWFGDDEAERRRRMDHERERTRHGSSAERGWNDERLGRGERGSTDDGRTEFERPTEPFRRWHEADYTSRPGSQYGHGDWFTPGWHPDDTRRQSTGARESRGYYQDYRGRVYQFEHPPGGAFAGRGPKGYRRSDERIREDVCDRLCDDPYIDASDIEVNVRNGEVMLTGTVHSRDDKRHSEEVAERVSGVTDVQNNLRVSRLEGPATTTTSPTAGTGAPPANAYRHDDLPSLTHAAVGRACPARLANPTGFAPRHCRLPAIGPCRLPALVDTASIARVNGRCPTFSLVGASAFLAKDAGAAG